MLALKNIPRQQLPFSAKNKQWRKQHLDWADRRTYFYDNVVRKSLLKKKINYNLVNGMLDMQDVMLILNPEQVNASYIPDSIQHYPIINPKLNVLRGEESKRRFDYKLIVTNPNAISEIEEIKRDEIFNNIKAIIESEVESEEEFNKELEKIGYYFNYEYQDIREERGNLLLNHYVKELSIPLKFNEGIMDAFICGEEMYMCDIVGGEPTFERLNPLKTHIFRSGYSNKIEDADIIVLLDFWSPSRIIDTYYESLTSKDVKYIDELPQSDYSSDMQNIDERESFVNFADVNGTEYGEGTVIDNYIMFGNAGVNSLTNYFDNNGNIRVLRVFWKSKRKIKKVKSYDPETGEEEFNFYAENYIINKDLGEEEEIFWINEAWEGTKIGKDIYVNMRPRPVQYNRMSNPSRCHFGIVGTIYNLNDSRPFSLVDLMKPFAYLYDVVHDRLNKAIAANWGKILRLDLALVPKGWEIEKWVHFAKNNHLAVVDSFKEGNIGSSTGKLAGGMNQNSTVIDAETGQYIQQHINLLESIKGEMSEACGISRQREGQISASETVGGVERATLQSSHITEFYFVTHDDTKKRALECFLETAKIALKGTSKKFQYILNSGSKKTLSLDGDEFAECDYGLVVDNSQSTQRLSENLQQLAQAALQNQSISLSAIMKIWASPSISETMRIIENEERNMQERQAQAQEQQLQSAQQIAEQVAATAQAELDLEDTINQRNNDVKLYIAELQASTVNNPIQRETLQEDKRQFNETISLEKIKVTNDRLLKEKALAKAKSSTKSSK